MSVKVSVKEATPKNTQTSQIRVLVRAGSKKEVVEVQKNGSLKIAVREPAEKNLANRRVRELVARYYRTIPSQVQIIKGHRSPKKIININTL